MGGTSEHRLKEIVQSRLLARLFQQSIKGEFALKGGMSMRTLANSRRFTKDIDMMAPPRLPQATVRARVRDAIRDLQGSGFIENVTFTEPKQTDTTQRWKIAGRVGGTEIHLTIEVSRRAELPPGHVTTTIWHAPPEAKVGAVFIDTLDMPALAVTKIACLASEKREAPRDVWDLFTLIQLGIDPASDLLRQLGHEDLARLADSLWGKLEKMDWDILRVSLLPFLEPGEASRMTPEIWEEIRLTVGTAVEHWVMKELRDRCSLSAANVAISDQKDDDEPAPPGGGGPK